MHSTRLLPPEVLALIFHYLEPKELYQCLLVSKLWHAEAEVRLYCAIDCLEREVPTEDLLDIFFDYRADDDNNNNNNNYDDDSIKNVSNSALSLVGRDGSGIEVQSTLPPVYSPGPNRPALTHFDFLGTVQLWSLLDSIMYRLTALTSLSLTFDSECPPIEDYCVDLEKILMGFPCLKHLSVTGWCSKYAYENARVQADGDHILPLASNNDATAGSRAFQQHPLESLVINPYLIWHHAPESYSFIRRLGSLRQLAIKNQRGYSRTLRRYKPWNFGRAMKQYCPKLEAINLDGAGLLWLFDLPILPSNRVDHLAALIPEPSAEDAERMSES
ncbi:hypothetical protein EC991_008057, partial [Linnemannia zychae]